MFRFVVSLVSKTSIITITVHFELNAAYIVLLYLNVKLIFAVFFCILAARLLMVLTFKGCIPLTDLAVQQLEHVTITQFTQKASIGSSSRTK